MKRLTDGTAHMMSNSNDWLSSTDSQRPIADFRWQMTDDHFNTRATSLAQMTEQQDEQRRRRPARVFPASSGISWGISDMQPNLSISESNLLEAHLLGMKAQMRIQKFCCLSEFPSSSQGTTRDLLEPGTLKGPLPSSGVERWKRES